MVSGQLAVLQTEIINMQTHEALFLPVGDLSSHFGGHVTDRIYSWKQNQTLIKMIVVIILNSRAV